MTEHAPTLLLTRPLPTSLAFLADCEARLGRKIPHVISPLIGIVPVDPSPNAKSAATVVLTSGNAVAVLGPWLNGRRVVTVGAKTAELAQAEGADAHAFGETATDLLERAGELTGPVLVCRGVHARVELALELEKRGVIASEAVVYDQTALPLTEDAKALLSGDLPVVAPVFSPRSAALLSAYDIAAPMIIPAISKAAAEAWQGQGDVRVAISPTAAALSDLVMKTL